MAKENALAASCVIFISRFMAVCLTKLVGTTVYAAFGRFHRSKLHISRKKRSSWQRRYMAVSRAYPGMAGRNILDERHEWFAAFKLNCSRRMGIGERQQGKYSAGTVYYIGLLDERLK